MIPVTFDLMIHMIIDKGATLTQLVFMNEHVLVKTTYLGINCKKYRPH